MAAVNFKAAFKKFPKQQQAALMATIEAAEAIFPGATRDIAWGMPTLKIGSDNLCHVMGFKNHNSLFPASGSIAANMGTALDKYVVTKGTIHFDLEKPFPKTLLKKVLMSRLEQINESYPKKNGVFVEYDKKGFIKVQGKMKNGELVTSLL